MPRVAEAAIDKRLVSKVVPLSELMTEAREWATQIAGLNSMAVQSAKQAMIGSRDLILQEGLRIEGEPLSSLVTSKDDAIKRTLLGEGLGGRA